MARDDYLPPDLEAKASSARRRQKLAETMLAQSLQPRQGRMAGRIYVAPSPLEGIAQVAQAWAANRAGERADEQLGEIGQQGRERTVKEIARIRGMMEGDPGVPAPQVAAGADEAAGMPMPAAEPLRQGVAPDPKRAVWEALFSPDRRVAEAGKVMFEGDQKAKLAATLAELKLAANGGDPSAVREYKYWQTLDPSRQQDYLAVKRTIPQFNLGDRIVVPNQVNPAGAPLAEYAKAPPPEQAPEFQGRQAEAKAAGSQRGAPEGSLAADKEFGKGIYNEWVTGGGRAAVAAGIPELENVVKQLRSGAKLSGPFIGVTPDWAMNFANPQAVSVREAVEKYVQNTLRPVLGAQFTRDEGERLIKRTFNPGLGEAENARRVENLLVQIKSMVAARDDAARYFEKNGSLTGWTGRLPTLADLEQASAPARTAPSLDERLDKYKPR